MGGVRGQVPEDEPLLAGPRAAHDLQDGAGEALARRGEGGLAVGECGAVVRIREGILVEVRHGADEGIVNAQEELAVRFGEAQLKRQLAGTREEIVIVVHLRGRSNGKRDLPVIAQALELVLGQVDGG